MEIFTSFQRGRVGIDGYCNILLPEQIEEDRINSKIGKGEKHRELLNKYMRERYTLKFDEDSIEKVRELIDLLYGPTYKGSLKPSELIKKIKVCSISK